MTEDEMIKELKELTAKYGPIGKHTTTKPEYPPILLVDSPIALGIHPIYSNTYVRTNKRFIFVYLLV